MDSLDDRRKKVSEHVGLVSCVHGIDPAVQHTIPARKLWGYITGRKTGNWTYAEQKLSSLGDRAVGGDEKLALPGVIFSGTFKHRAAEHLIATSGLVPLDYDKSDKYNATPTEIGQVLKERCPQAVAYYETPSRKGFRVLCWAEWIAADGSNWELTHKAADDVVSDVISEYLSEKNGEPNSVRWESDPVAGDLPHFFFLSRDPNAWWDDDALPLVEPAPPPKPPAPKVIKRAIGGDQRELTESQVDQILGKLDPDCDRKEWVTIVFAVRAWGEAVGDPTAARRLARNWSADSKEGKFEEKDFDARWNERSRSGKRAGVGTLVLKGQEAGWQYEPPEPEAPKYRSVADFVGKPKPQPTSQLSQVSVAPQADTAPPPEPENVLSATEQAMAEISVSAVHPVTGDPYNLWEQDWDVNNVLPLIRYHAARHYISPVALGGIMLAHSAASISHNWELPPRAGNDKGGRGAPLCLYVCLAAPPGVGKSDAASQARWLIQHEPHDHHTTTTTFGYTGADRYAPIQEEGAPVSAEAIAEMFMAEIEDADGNKKRQAIKHRALWVYDEIGQLKAVSSRQGNPLYAVQNTAWSGGELSTRTASQERNRLVPQQTYTIGMVVAAQFVNASALLNETDTGTAQRLLWLPVNTPSDNEGRQLAEQLAASQPDGQLPRITLKHWDIPRQPAIPNPSGLKQASGAAGANADPELFQIRVPAEVTEYILAGADSALSGVPMSAEQTAQQELTGAAPSVNKHANQMRLRIAVHWARLCGFDKPEITPELWTHAGAWMTVAHRTAEALRDIATQEAHEANRRRRGELGRDKIHVARKQHVEARNVIEALAKRAASSIARKADKLGGKINSRQATHAISAAVKREGVVLSLKATELADLALAVLTDDELMEEAGDDWQLTAKGKREL